MPTHGFGAAVLGLRSPLARPQQTSSAHSGRSRARKYTHQSTGAGGSGAGGSPPRPAADARSRGGAAASAGAVGGADAFSRGGGGGGGGPPLSAIDAELLRGLKDGGSSAHYDTSQPFGADLTITRYFAGLASAHGGGGGHHGGHGAHGHGNSSAYRALHHGPGSPQQQQTPHGGVKSPRSGDAEARSPRSRALAKGASRDAPPAAAESKSADTATAAAAAATAAASDIKTADGGGGGGSATPPTVPASPVLVPAAAAPSPLSASSAAAAQAQAAAAADAAAAALSASRVVEFLRRRGFTDGGAHALRELCKQIIAKPPAQRTEADVHALFVWVLSLNCKLFAELSEAVVKDVVSKIEYEHVPHADTVVFRQGDASTKLYIVIRGSVSVWISRSHHGHGAGARGAGGGGHARGKSRGDAEYDQAVARERTRNREAAAKAAAAAAAALKSPHGSGPTPRGSIGVLQRRGSSRLSGGALPTSVSAAVGGASPAHHMRSPSGAGHRRTRSASRGSSGGNDFAATLAASLAAAAAAAAEEADAAAASSAAASSDDEADSHSGNASGKPDASSKPGSAQGGGRAAAAPIDTLAVPRAGGTTLDTIPATPVAAAATSATPGTTTTAVPALPASSGGGGGGSSAAVLPPSGGEPVQLNTTVAIGSSSSSSSASSSSTDATAGAVAAGASAALAVASSSLSASATTAGRSSSSSASTAAAASPAAASSAATSSSTAPAAVSSSAASAVPAAPPQPPPPPRPSMVAAIPAAVSAHHDSGGGHGRSKQPKGAKLIGIIRAGARNSAFGELGLISNETRSATIMTEENGCEFLTLSKADFDAVLKRRYAEDITLKKQAIRKFELFRGWAEESLITKLALYLERRVFTANTDIVRQNQAEHFLYFIVSGECQLTHTISVDEPVVGAAHTGTNGSGANARVIKDYQLVLALLCAGQMFGEAAATGTAVAPAPGAAAPTATDGAAAAAGAQGGGGALCGVHSMSRVECFVIHRDHFTACVKASTLAQLKARVLLQNEWRRTRIAQLTDKLRATAESLAIASSSAASDQSTASLARGGAALLVSPRTRHVAHARELNALVAAAQGTSRRVPAFRTAVAGPTAGVGVTLLRNNQQHSGSAAPAAAAAAAGGATAGPVQHPSAVAYPSAAARDALGTLSHSLKQSHGRIAPVSHRQQLRAMSRPTTALTDTLSRPGTAAASQHSHYVLALPKGGATGSMSARVSTFSNVAANAGWDKISTVAPPVVRYRAARDVDGDADRKQQQPAPPPLPLQARTTAAVSFSAPVRLAGLSAPKKGHSWSEIVQFAPQPATTAGAAGAGEGLPAQFSHSNYQDKRMHSFATVVNMMPRSPPPPAPNNVALTRAPESIDVAELLPPPTQESHTHTIASASRAVTHLFRPMSGARRPVKDYRVRDDNPTADPIH